MLVKKSPNFIGLAAHLADKPSFEAASKVFPSLSCKKGCLTCLQFFFFKQGVKTSGLKLVRKLDLGVP